MKTRAEWAAYAEGLERCIAAQTDREMDLRWQLANTTGQLKEAQRQAGAFCHKAMQLEQRLATANTVKTAPNPFGIQFLGGHHG